MVTFVWTMFVYRNYYILLFDVRIGRSSYTVNVNQTKHLHISFRNKQCQSISYILPSYTSQYSISFQSAILFKSKPLFAMRGHLQYSMFRRYICNMTHWTCPQSICFWNDYSIFVYFALYNLKCMKNWKKLNC